MVGLGSAGLWVPPRPAVFPGDRFVTGAGRYYAIPHSGVNTITNPSGNMDASPFPVGRTITLASILCEVTTGAGSSFARMAVYRDDGKGYPGTLLIDSGQIDSSAAAIKEILSGSWVYNAVNSVLVPDLYWLCAGPQGGTVAFRSFGPNVTKPWIYGKTNTDHFPASTPASYIITGVSGAYPDPCPADLNPGASGILVAVKVA